MEVILLSSFYRHFVSSRYIFTIRLYCNDFVWPMNESLRYFTREVNATNIRHFNAIIHMLNKVGKENIIEKTIDGNIILRSLNDTSSAILVIEFDNRFWAHNREHQADKLGPFSCKIQGRSICAALHNLKKITTLNFYPENLDGENNVVLELLTQDGIIRTHRFPYQDCDILNAVFDEESSRALQTQPKVLSELMDHLYTAPEIMIEATSNSFGLRSVHSAQKNGVDKKPHLTTDLNVQVNEFDHYSFHIPQTNSQIEESENFAAKMVLLYKEV